MPTDEAITFLRGLYGEIEDGDGHILIWQLSDKSSAWFTKPEQAAQYAAEKSDIYVGAGLRSRALGRSKRGGSEDVIAIPGLWLDLDVEGPGRIPRDDVLRFLNKIFPQVPTVIVDTGGGFHPWWLFKELWKLINRVECEKASRLITGWQRHIIAAAQDQGFKIDNTSDLSRVMRIPGTVNTKYNEQRIVKTFKSEWLRRHDPDDLLDFLDGIEQNLPGKKAPIIPLKNKKEMDFSPVNAETLAARCPWLRHCHNDAEELTEPEWFHMIGVLARCEKGEQAAQEWSSPYPGYSKTETENKVIQAIAAAAPVKCETVALNFGDKWCSSCVYKGQVGSPISVGMFPAPRDLPSVRVVDNAGPPLHKWEALSANEPKARDSFERKRRNLNAAGCEISLATLAAGAGWTAQEICNLLIAHHIHHNEKLRAADYYARLIALGIHNASKKIAQSKISDICAIGSTEGLTGNVERDRKMLLELISKCIGIKVSAFLRYLTDPPTYRLETEKGSVDLGHNCLNQEKFRQATYDATKRMVHRMKGSEWDQLLQAFADASIDIYTGPEATDADAIALWLESYFDELKIPNEESEVFLAVRDGRPFFWQGKIRFFGPHFRQWLLLSSFSQKISPKKMGVLFRRHGCNSESTRIEGRVYQTWQMPSREKKE